MMGEREVGDPYRRTNDSNLRVCSATTPAPTEDWSTHDSYRRRISMGWFHPDAIGRCINDDHDDWKYQCPHCNGTHISEGDDG